MIVKVGAVEDGGQPQEEGSPLDTQASPPCDTVVRQVACCGTDLITSDEKSPLKSLVRLQTNVLRKPNRLLPALGTKTFPCAFSAHISQEGSYGHQSRHRSICRNTFVRLYGVGNRPYLLTSKRKALVKRTDKGNSPASPKRTAVVFVYRIQGILCLDHKPQCLINQTFTRWANAA